MDGQFQKMIIALAAVTFRCLIVRRLIFMDVNGVLMEVEHVKM